MRGRAHGAMGCSSEWCSSWKRALKWLVLLLSCDGLSPAVPVPLRCAAVSVRSRWPRASVALPRAAKEPHKGSKGGSKRLLSDGNEARTQRDGGDGQREGNAVSARWSGVRAVPLSPAAVPAPRCWPFRCPPLRCWAAPRRGEADRTGPLLATQRGENERITQH